MDLETLREVKERLNLGGLSKEALVGVVAILVVVALVASRMLVGAGEGIEIDRAEATQTAVSEAATGQEGSAEAVPLFVHVSGAVNSPGLCEVEQGARVADAVQAAGGFTDDAAMDSVNLARLVSDGEQIVVATREQVDSGASSPSGQAASATSASANSSGRININRASAAELTQLPGIGESTAAKIVADREANGPYQTIEDLKRVSGVGDKKFEAIANLICV